MFEYLPRSVIWALIKIGGVVNEGVDLIAEHICGL